MHDTLTLPDSLTLDAAEVIVPFTTPGESPERIPFRGVRRILLPFDLSRAGASALRIVTEFAAKTGATLHVLHVVRPCEASGIPPKSSRAEDKVAEASERLLKEWVKRIVQGRARVFVSVRVGDPVEVILARAIATRADMIVMTSRSCGGLNFELQRSTAERVSRFAPCPVMTIPEKCREEIAYDEAFRWSDWQTIFIPVDFSTAARNSLRLASTVAHETGAKILLAHGAAGEEAGEQLLRQRLETWARRLVDQPVFCQTVIWPGGHSLYAILSEAARAEANLIVLPTTTQSWARRLRAGSITDGILRQAPCPVISLNENVFRNEQ